MDNYNLGSYSRKITTRSDQTQIWFDRGLIWTYAYNHEEAITCFEKAPEFDKDCALAHWQLASDMLKVCNNGWAATGATATVFKFS